MYLLHHLLTEAASRGPDNVAVRCRGREITYGALEAAAGGIASTLVDCGIRPGDRVGLQLPKSIEMVAAVYGILRAGAVYVPLDLRAPVRRVATIAADCEVAGLVATPQGAASILRSVDTSRVRCVLVVDEGGSEAGPADAIPFAEAASRGGDLLVRGIDADLAYILYTSGSTGVPKGVMLSHRHAMSFVRWCGSEFGFGPDDRFSNHAPLHFDLSVFDFFVSALAGATVVPVPDEHAYFGAELAAFAKSEEITVWYSVPSALMLMARHLPEPGYLSKLRSVIFAGEVYPTPELRTLRGLLPEAQLWNLYGPTETNVCTYYRVGDLPADHLTIPIGRACENTQVFALRPDGTVAGIGEEGELYVRGASVMNGYWGRTEKSSEVLVPDPFGRGPRDLAYKTGDLVRLRPDGDYEFLGRRDHQIKSRGYRIELGDIEAALATDPDLIDSAVVARPHPRWGAEIIAWVVPRSGIEVSEVTVRRHLSSLVPRYMLPARVIVSAEGLPRTSNGKVDRTRMKQASGGHSEEMDLDRDQAGQKVMAVEVGT